MDPTDQSTPSTPPTAAPSLDTAKFVAAVRSQQPALGMRILADSTTAYHTLITDTFAYVQTLDDHSAGQVWLSDGVFLSARGPALWQQPVASHASVLCGRQFSQGDYCYHCRDCEADRSCVVCVDCFVEELHADHDFRLVRSGGGCCDCGDETAWAVDGMCAAHGAKNRVVAALDEREQGSARAVLLQLNAALIEAVGAVRVPVLRALAGAVCNLIAKRGDAMALLCAKTLLAHGGARALLLAHHTLPVDVRRAWVLAVSQLFVHLPFKQFVGEIYVELMRETFAPAVRGEPIDEEHTIASLGVQYLTVPSIAAHLTVEKQLLEHMLELLTRMFANRAADTHLLDTSHAVIVERTYWRLVNDLGHCLTPFVAQHLCYSPALLARLLELLASLQGADPNRRFLGHPSRDPFNVEYMFNLWLNVKDLVAHTVRGLVRGVEPQLPREMPQASEPRIAGAVAHDDERSAAWLRGASSDAQLAQFADTRVARAMVRVLTLAAQKCVADRTARAWLLDDVWRGTARVFECNLIDGRHGVSLHLPLHRTLGAMLGGAIATWPALVVPLEQLLGAPVDSEAFERGALTLLELPLQVIVLSSQVRRGRWTRNGIHLLQQMALFWHSQFRDVRQHDLLLMQYTAAELARLSARPLFLAAVLHRWTCSEQLALSTRHRPLDVPASAFPPSSEEADHDTLAQAHGALVDAMRFVVAVTADRVVAGGERRLDRLRHCLIHLLAVAPLKYSVLVARVPKHLRCASFESVLDAVSTPRAGDAGGDAGSRRYELRREAWAEFTGHFWLWSAEQREKARNNFDMALKREPQRLAAAGLPRFRPPHHQMYSLGVELQRAQLHAMVFACLFNTAVSDQTLASLAVADEAAQLLALIVDAAQQTNLEAPAAASDNDAKQTEVPVIRTTAWYRAFAHNNIYVNATKQFRANDSSHANVSMLAAIASLLASEPMAALHRALRFSVERLCAASDACRNEWTRVGGVAESQTNVAAERAAKKQRAARRRQRLLAQFRTQQDSFAAANVAATAAATTEDDESASSSMMEDSSNAVGFEQGDEVCVICRESAASACYITSIERIQLKFEDAADNEANFVVDGAENDDDNDDDDDDDNGNDDDDNNEESQNEMSDEVDDYNSDGFADDTDSQDAEEAEAEDFRFLLQMAAEEAEEEEEEELEEEQEEEEFEGEEEQLQQKEIEKDQIQISKVDFGVHEHALFIQQCGHRMHENCFHEFYRTFGPQALSAAHFARMDVDVASCQFLCPLCKKMANCVMPHTDDATLPLSFDGQEEPFEPASNDELDERDDWTLHDVSPIALSDAQSNFLTRLRAVDEASEIVEEQWRWRALLNGIRALTGTLRRVELCQRAIGGEGEWQLSALLAYAQTPALRRTLQTCTRLLRLLLSTLSRPQARLWLSCFAVETQGTGDSFDALCALTVLQHVASAQRVGQFSRGALREHMQRVFEACVDALRESGGGDGERIELILQRQALLLRLVVDAQCDEPTAAAPLRQRSDTKRLKRTAERATLELDGALLQQQMRGFAWGRELPTRYQTPSFLMQWTRSACQLCVTVKRMRRPLLCMLCGLVFDNCDNYRHVAEHGRAHPSGMLFLELKDSSVYWHRGNLFARSAGTLYLDAHNETDIGLRRGKPLFLCRKRWAKMIERYLLQAMHNHLIKNL